MALRQTQPGSIAGNIALFLGGVILTIIILGLASGSLSRWIADSISLWRQPNPSPSPSVKPVATVKPSLEPSPLPTTDETTDPLVPTTKGGLVLGSEATTNNVADYLTFVYETRSSADRPWLLRANYDTRYEARIDFDEASLGDERRLTICQYVSGQQLACQVATDSIGTHSSPYLLRGQSHSYQVFADQQGPTIQFATPWRNSQGQTCIKVINVQDNISPVSRITQLEKMDNAEYRSLHPEYCVSGQAGETHLYSVKATDERGNTTEQSHTFIIH